MDAASGKETGADPWPWIFLSCFVTSNFHALGLGDPASLSLPPSLLLSPKELFPPTEMFSCCGVFLLFVTGDCPEGDREPR